MSEKEPKKEPKKGRKKGRKKEPKKGHKKGINITRLVVGHRPPNVKPYGCFVPSFNPLSQKIGEDALTIVFGYIAFDVKNTRQCGGFQCPERFYRDSRYFYCRPCYLQRKEDGFDAYELVNRHPCPECGLLTCVCVDIDRCEWCRCSYTLCIC